ncbi:CopG family transcriptional regulator [Komagataeibacter nataicola]|uniref:CopG family transcriptional regulator n=1 Tax=Acetobacteraceae TaxID=433 RepID=UPI001BACF8DA|nr:MULTISPECIES: CopG family transcriptional regulator [Acetobacteraceae]MBS0967166.1 CopG family transcriptional regulator [Acetobacter okinawensis]WEQ55023.1 CopG family transcriptional regulator [Komagataeibacter nataicola]
MTSSRQKKKRLSVYLEPHLWKGLRTQAARRSMSDSLLAEAAIAAWLDPESAGGDPRASLDAALRRLDRRQARIERDLSISVETLALFIRLWFTSMPGLPDSVAAAARAQGAERYDRFVEMLGRRLAGDKRFRTDVERETSDTTNAPGEKEGAP